MSMLDQFGQVVDRFGRVAGYAIGGTAIIPIIGAFSGIAPTWPEGLAVISALLVLITLMIVFHFFTAKRRWVFSTLFILAVTALLLSIAAYSYMRAEFVMQHPTYKESIILGCEWRQQAVEVAKGRGIPTADQCPGEFRDMLLEARDQYDIWTDRSIREVAMLMASLWAAIFISLAIAIGSFVIWYANQKPRNDLDDANPSPSV